MNTATSGIHPAVLCSGWAILAAIGILRFLCADSNQTVEVGTLVLESTVFGATVVVSIGAARRVWRSLAFVLATVMTALATHWLVFIWIWYNFASGSSDLPVVVVPYALGAFATALAVGLALERSLLTLRFNKQATLAGALAGVPITIVSLLPRFPLGSWTTEVMKFLWFSSFLLVLWSNGKQLSDGFERVSRAS